MDANVLQYKIICRYIDFILFNNICTTCDQ